MVFAVPDRKEALNRLAPATSKAKLGDVVADLIAAYNALATKYNALAAKLDADTGVAGTDYVSLHGGATQVTTIDNR